MFISFCLQVLSIDCSSVNVPSSTHRHAKAQPAPRSHRTSTASDIQHTFGSSAAAASSSSPASSGAPKSSRPGSSHRQSPLQEGANANTCELGMEVLCIDYDAMRKVVITGHISGLIQVGSGN